MHLGAAPAALLARLQGDEAATVAELCDRDDTRALIVRDGEKLVGYAVFGLDRNDMLTVYAARSFTHWLAKAAMQAVFGAAQIMGAPVRVHTEKVRAMARMMGADDAIAGFDLDGVPMGVFV